MKMRRWQHSPPLRWQPGLISRGIMMEAASGCVGCACGGKPRREFHHVCHTFQSVRVCVCVEEGFVWRRGASNR